jgi:4-amino-4-deoxy-L-arabinose transferase-like glycosyltransferase
MKTARWLAQMLAQPAVSLFVLLVTTAGLVWFRLPSAPPPWFDEGYRLNMARVLTEQGVYATETRDRLWLFDPGVGTGPVDTLALAAAFRVLGIGVLQGRLATTVFVLIAVAALYLIAGEVLERWAAVVATLFVVALPVPRDSSLLMLGRQVMGEVPALSLILLGLWVWFRSWRTESWAVALGAGLLIGLGLLSKSQMVFGVAPALLVISLARMADQRRLIVRELATGGAVVAVLIGWPAFSNLQISPAERAENSALLAEMVATTLFPGSYGRYVQPGGWVAVALAGISLGLALNAGRARSVRDWGVAEWALLSLAAIGAAHSLWFVIFSVGWVRYAFLIWQTSLVVIALSLLRLLCPWLNTDGRRAAVTAVGMIALAGFGLLAVTQADRDSGYAQTVAYVQTRVPAPAVIESWEWELFVSIGQERVHTPNTSDLSQATRMRVQPDNTERWEYDPLGANPDYLIVGQMASWTGIYPPHLIARYFVLEAQYGDYDIYRRVR